MSQAGNDFGETAVPLEMVETHRMFWFPVGAFRISYLMGHRVNWLKDFAKRFPEVIWSYDSLV